MRDHVSYPFKITGDIAVLYILMLMILGNTRLATLSWYFVDHASPYSLFYLYFQLDTLFSSVYVQCLGFLFSLHVSGLTGPSSGGLNCTYSQWYSPPLQVSL
jgi:hypothetical protein